MNEDIKAYAKEKKVKLWQIADTLEMTDSQFSRKLRYELEYDLRQTIINIVDRIAATQRGE